MMGKRKVGQLDMLGSLRRAMKTGRVITSDVLQLIDEKWYLEVYPDVAGAAFPAAEHYMSVGWAEGRNPNPLFDTEWYFAQNPDVELSGANPLLHFISAGSREGRDPHPLFDTSFYLEHNPDVAAAGVNPLTHYLRTGGSEKRRPHPLFDAKWYVENNADVADANALVHYVTQGASELRQPNPLFDAVWYCKKYPEAATNPLAHYAKYGFSRRLQPHPLFDGAYYLDYYPDVAQAGVNPLGHYLIRGAFETRNPNPDFDAYNYLATNPEIADNKQPPLLHFIQDPKIKAVGTKSARIDELLGAYENYSEYCSSAIGDAFPIEPDGIDASEFSDLGTLGVHLHLFYESMADKFVRSLANIPVPFDLYVSVEEGAHIPKIQDAFEGLPTVSKLVIQSFPNKGRDIGPWLFGFGQRLLKYDLICHVHSKRSPHNKLKRDWCTQLLHHLFATKTHTAKILQLFRDNDRLGIIFPIYHSSLKTQIGWGTNFEHCNSLANRLGYALDVDDLEPFPAGSFFFARTSALLPLLNSGFTLEDFPEEAAQIDGTLAHAVERLLSVIAKNEGYAWKQVRSTKPHTLSTSIMKPEELQLQSDLFSKTHEDRLAAWPEARVCVFSCNTGGYDKPVDHTRRIKGADYILFTDQPVEVGSWHVRKTAFWDHRAVRIARFCKTNPQQLLSNYDIAIWVDGNVQIRGDITKYIEKVLAQNASFGVVSHPYRDCLYSEAEILKLLNRDSPEVIDRQIAEYRRQGFPEKFGLTETNFLIMDLQRNETQDALNIWWSEINRHSFRDQLSFDFACWKAGAKRVSLFDEGGSVRSNADFTYFKHGISPLSSAPQETKPQSLSVPASTKQAVKTAQIVICIHNALTDVQKCVESVARHTQDFHRVLLINDNSERATSEFVSAFVENRPNFHLKTLSGGAYGYCRAANEGLLKTDYGDAVMMLNSDTIVGPNWLEGLMETANTVARFGIVGPMSNAASFQSLPDTKSSPSQTAVNTWPTSISIEEANELCKIWSDKHVAPIVPLVHGFCQLISRDLLTSVGGFDSDLFPKGYGEENDLCFRASHAGFRHLIDLRTFVYHEKSKSYTNSAVREELMRAGGAALKKRHGERQVLDAIKALEANPTLVSMREKARSHLSRLALQKQSEEEHDP